VLSIRGQDSRQDEKVLSRSSALKHYDQPTKAAEATWEYGSPDFVL